MKLERLTERIWFLPYEEARDRPNLGYIRGDRFSVAVDAGHSAAHTQLFYQALVESGLPLPAVTILTHWHWDHTFGMHAIHGISVAGQRTGQHLLRFQSRLDREGTGFFFAMDERIVCEYAELPVIVTLPDMVFSDGMQLDAGHCLIRLYEAESPHTDDSTLIEVPGERTLFLGDACCGTFPTWEKDGALCRRLADTILKADADICLEGHWTPLSRDETVRGLLEDCDAN
ncbi:MAG: MBL fold metallo-hydrolase [Clostridia bacterium]|nr:MBL fold metallo-hydrolase [Clostridia bacterium]